ncbi:PAS domain S-box protein [Paraburkholderia sp. MMS20-SJTN17]|uniref:histidine kinase n=1 Tax=Paraburkholderia translucens TaxID=2886945 RepID=A0ABS8KC08_9BURK|nr:PAS domain S-box protein [Paraburkholderia sp. MMS20-SJTN17]MCC8402304.1 PAS domain S-box protein [Paraburkholderia sp. MMS20-SJTN17]
MPDRSGHEVSEQEATLPASRSWLEAWVRTTENVGLFAVSENGTVLTWSPGCERMCGYPPAAIVGHSIDMLFASESDASRVRAALATLATRNEVELESLCCRKDKSRFWAEFVVTRLTAFSSEPNLAVLIRDASDKRQAYDEAIESGRAFRMLVGGVTDYAIFMLDPHGVVTSWNPGARRIKGYSEEDILGSHFSRFYTPEDAAAGAPQRGLDTARREGRFEAEGWRVRKDSSRFWAHVVIDAIYDDHGKLAGFAKITRDITDRAEAAKLLEQTRNELFQSQKMEALGKLTGGVAHDFNNLLQILRGNLELLAVRYRSDVWTRERLEKASEAIERGAKLSMQLLAFGRRQPLAADVINIGDMLKGMDDLLRRALGEEVQIGTVVAPELWNNLLDSHQLENVILNLCINARDAMPNGGKLVIAACNTILDDEHVRGLEDVAPGEYVMVSVTDTGTGMTPEVMEKAFDPFFTTKGDGQSSGLGLSMAYGYVKQSGGHIGISSRVGHGTAVKMYFPRSAGQVTRAVLEESVPAAGGHETILVVEDDRIVQSTVIEMLVSLGYHVLKADNATQALTILRSGVRVDMLFTDVVMPGSMASPEMVRIALSLLPDLKVLYTSGYAQTAIIHDGKLDRGVQLLSKPYSRERLAQKIRQVFEAKDASAGTKARQASRVLVVEDEPESLEATCELIRMIGHEASPALDANIARQALRTGHFDVLLTDLRLPGMSGSDFAMEASRVDPSIRVIIASGQFPDTGGLPGVASPEQNGWRMLLKPFTAQQLQQAIEE